MHNSAYSHISLQRKCKIFCDFQGFQLAFDSQDLSFSFIRLKIEQITTQRVHQDLTITQTVIFREAL